MRDWHLQQGDPLCLTLVVDARLCTPDYFDDHIWELNLRQGEPPAIELTTTFGLRARSLRLFPRFTEGDQTITDPAEFSAQPVIHRFFPNYLLVTFSPFPGIDVVNEYWVPENQAIAGHLRIVNGGVTPRKLNFDLVAILNPTQDGQRMSPEKMQAVTILHGMSADLYPLVFLTGGSQASLSPYPCLSQTIELLPGTDHTFTWVQVAAKSPEESFERARQISARNWAAERARIELLNTSQVEIYTGDPQWDAAFAWAQKVALGLIHGPTELLPHQSFVLNRQPDQGFSLRGDGSDYDYLWNGQTALEAWYLAIQLLPTEPTVSQGLLRNFLAVQAQEGYVDWKPGLGGQRSRLDATPLLATMAWQTFQITDDTRFLEEVFPDLLTFVLSWFSPYHDRDGDGIPEWDHPMQSGFEDHPTFAHWHPWSQGVDITTSESPVLCAFLFQECQSLISIARQIQRPEPIPSLQSLANRLHRTVESCWDSPSGSYRYRDRDSHLSPAGEIITRHKGSGIKNVQRALPHPTRFIVRVQSDQQTTHTAQVTMSGKDKDGNTIEEHFGPQEFRWFLGQGSATSSQVFSSLDRLQVDQVRNIDEIILQSVDYTILDHSLLLPLWAGIPDPKKAQQMIEKTVLHPKRFGRSFGIPACTGENLTMENEICQSVWMPWNALIGMGLLRYGFRKQAAELVNQLMAGVILNLKRERAFRRHYNAQTGSGSGERNTLDGLPPIGLFLQTLGVQLISPWRVRLEGTNPFPWPVEIKYRGLSIQRGKRGTRVIFPNGQSTKINHTKACVVEGKPDPTGPNQA